jgi:hypothetical protein
VPGGPWGTISTQEFLAPDPASPYSSTAPDTAPPRLSLTLHQSPTPGGLSIAAQTADAQDITQITWFLDDLEHPAHLGDSWTLAASALTPGSHHLIVYAVDASQNFTEATFSLKVGQDGIPPAGT